MQSPTYIPNDDDANKTIIQSPLYDPKTPELYIDNGDDDDDAKNHSTCNTTNFIQKIKTRNRIYGEEYKISTYLNVNPAKNPKILKLEQPIFEVHSNATTYRTECPAIAPHPSGTPLKPNQQQSKMDCSDSDEDDNTCNIPIVQECTVINDGDDDNYNDDDNDDEDADNNALLKNLKDFSPKYNIPIPSITKRPFVNFTLNKNDIPKLCNRCFAISCVCKFLENKSHT